MTRGNTVAARILIAGNSAERRRGLLKTEALCEGEGLWIAPCEAIHTIGMRWPIDVLFLDRSYRVRKIVRELPPWRIAICLTASSVLELSAGVLRSTGTEIGDIISFHPT